MLIDMHYYVRCVPPISHSFRHKLIHTESFSNQGKSLFSYIKVLKTGVCFVPAVMKKSVKHDVINTIVWKLPFTFWQTNHPLIMSNYNIFYILHFTLTVPNKVLHSGFFSFTFFFYMKKGWWKPGGFFVSLRVCWAAANFVCGETVAFRRRISKCISAARLWRRRGAPWRPDEPMDPPTTGADSGPTSERR